MYSNMEVEAKKVSHMFVWELSIFNLICITLNTLQMYGNMEVEAKKVSHMFMWELSIFNVLCITLNMPQLILKKSKFANLCYYQPFN